jgi:hypothetical protein
VTTKENDIEKVEARHDPEWVEWAVFYKVYDSKGNKNMV